MVCTAEGSICAVSLLCCCSLPLSEVPDLVRDHHSNHLLKIWWETSALSVSVCARGHNSQTSSYFLFLRWFLQIHDRSEHSLGVCWSVCFIFYLPFWKWGLSLWPVVFLSPSAAMVLPFLLQTCAVFTSHVKFQEWAFLLETCNQKWRQESSFSIQNYAAGAKSFSQFTLPSCQLQRGGLLRQEWRQGRWGKKTAARLVWDRSLVP